jgi:hypothetical protein
LYLRAAATSSRRNPPARRSPALPPNADRQTSPAAFRLPEGMRLGA